MKAVIHEAERPERESFTRDANNWPAGLYRANEDHDCYVLVTGGVALMIGVGEDETCFRHADNLGFTYERLPEGSTLTVTV